MAIDPRISLMGQAPDFGQTVGNALLNVQRIQEMGRQQQAAEAQQAQQARLNEILSAGSPAGSGQVTVPPGTVGIAGPVEIEGQSAGVVSAPPRQLSPQQMAALAIEFPERFEQINHNLGLITQQQKTEAADFSFNLLNTPFEQRESKIRQRVANLQAQGRDPSGTVQLLGQDQASQDQALNAVQVAALSPEKRVELAEKRRLDPLKQIELGIKKQTLDIRREENNQRRLDRQLARETNELKREQLQVKIDESKRASEQNKRDLEFEANNAVQAVDSTINTVDRLLSGEGLEAAAGVSSLFPTLPGSRAADFEATLETLQSQAFLSQVEKMKGLGALSENEGKKLGAALGSLSISMSDESLRKELGRIKQTLTKAKNEINKKFNKPVSGQVGRFNVEVVE